MGAASKDCAQAIGMSQSAISRIWRAFSLQPHRVETFKLSTDPFFVEKVRDIVGLYLNPPERALVLCVDEESQVQALDRIRPVLPLRPVLANSPRLLGWTDSGLLNGARDGAGYRAVDQDFEIVE